MTTEQITQDEIAEYSQSRERALDDDDPQTFDLFASVFTTPLRATIQSENCSEPLTVVSRTWEPGADLPAADLPAEVVYLSADGRSFLTAWHFGPESDAAVYVEIRRRHGASFHGWVDAVSRKIVQAG